MSSQLSRSDATASHSRPEPEAHPFSTAPHESLPRRILRSANTGLYWSGAAAAYSRATVPQCAVILTYHSVLGPGEERWIDPSNALTSHTFEAQMRFLAGHRRVISLTRL